jgi:DNA phosphorothioation-dependent restriction protein DptH
MEQSRIDLLTDEIIRNFRQTMDGHCARVDFLQHEEALAACQSLRQQQPQPSINAYILTTQHDQPDSNSFYLTTDRAIELRNRKHDRLCLFVPADSVDAAFSSLANSFAVIDGRALHDTVLKQLRAKLPAHVRTIVQEILHQLRSPLRISKDQQIEFVCAVRDLISRNEIDKIGLELWRLGLIVDASPDFINSLERNRRSVLYLAHPTRYHAALRERIQELGVDVETARELVRFFQNRYMQDVSQWSKELIQAQLTFDRWNFPLENPSDIREVRILPFINATGQVEPYCKLKQPNGQGGDLRASCGKKETLVVCWKSDPPRPRNLSRWRVEIIPSGDEDYDIDIDLPAREVPGSRNNVTLKLDMELDEALDFALVARVTPIDVSGNEIKDQETEQIIYDTSDEFFLVPEQPVEPVPSGPDRKSYATVPTIAYGRLEEATKTREDNLSEVEPHWLTKDLDYFCVRLGERRTPINVGLSHTLHALEKQILAEPRSGGIFLLTLDDVHPVTDQAFTAYQLRYGQGDTWTPFWRARESFFQRIKKAEAREVLEAIDWIPDLASAAARYAQAYNDLIQFLTQQAIREELLEALSLDSIILHVADGLGENEEAIITLPTHPLRSAWIASYTQLLRKWEEQLLSLPPGERKSAIDMEALRLLVPTNVPAFAFHIASTHPFVFFQNLRFFHGVHLPAAVPDPHRRFGDIATILGTEFDQVPIGDIQPQKLVNHLLKFLDMHPYIETLVTTLLNPDRGEFFAEALKMLLRQVASEDEEKSEKPLHLQVTSYVEDERQGTMQALDQVRQVQSENLQTGGTDYFLPGIMTTLRSSNRLGNEALPDAHLAVVTDFTHPGITAIPHHAGEQSDVRSFSLYGLVNRFVPQFIEEQDDFVWRYHIMAEGSKQIEPHPARRQYSDALVALQTSLLDAWGKVLDDNAQAHPVLEVRLEAKRRRLLEMLHSSANWVITLDRFFALDYYDSPFVSTLQNMARKYVLDYSPEFAEGLGHRMMVTTSWHEEIGSLLRQAMEEQGFSAVEESVSGLLHYLKTVSGSLALQALESTTNASAAVGLGVVTAWLRRRGRLAQSVLIPVDLHPRLFSKSGAPSPATGERRCDLVLFSLKRNIVEATFIEVKWRRGRAAIDRLAEDMILQMHGSAQAMRNRFFTEDCIDGALQRSYLANVLRFYFERSQRYQLFETDAEATFLEHLTKLEKNNLTFKASYEGYIVCMEEIPRKPIMIKDAKITILTAQDFEQLPALQTLSSMDKDSGDDFASEYLDEQEEPVPQNDHADAQNMAAMEQPEIASSQEKDQNAEKDIETDQSEEIVVPLGESVRGVVNWMPSTKGSPHLFIVGMPGQGKSWTTTRILCELGVQNVPPLVLDFHGTFADDQGHFVQKVHPTVMDAAAGLPFSPFECSVNGGPNSWRANAYALAEIFGYVADLGEIQQDILYQAIRDAYLANGFGDEQSTPRIYPTMEEVLTRVEKQEKSRHVANVSARCRPLFEMDLFQPETGNSDLLTQIRKGLIVDLHNLYLETVQLAAGAFVLQKLYKDMFHWGLAEHIRLAVVLDEAHRLARDVTLPKLMKEGRKFGIAVIVASQGLGDFHPDVLENAGTKVIFRTNFPQSKKIAGFIRTRPGQDIVARIEQLPVGSAYVQTPEMQFGELTRMYPL